MNLVKEDGRWRARMEPPGTSPSPSNAGPGAVSGDSPAEVGRKAFKAVESGDRAALDKLTASSPKARRDMDGALGEGTSDIRSRGGIKSIVTKDERINGDRAVVSYDITWGNGTSRGWNLRLVKENGAWRLEQW
jgi:hypothetical protein